MNLDDYLDTVDLIDCSGTVTHRLTLMVDGRVRVRVGGVDSFVDPGTRTVLPPVRQLGRGEYGHQQIVEIACNLGRR